MGSETPRIFMRTLYLQKQGSTLQKNGERFLVRWNQQTLLEVPVCNVEQICLLGNVQVSTFAGTPPETISTGKNQRICPVGDEIREGDGGTLLVGLLRYTRCQTVAEGCEVDGRVWKTSSKECF
ncbi:MAG: CRISPR-associated endonuclease Cas1 [Planctomycetia bacterium]|nr:CRISPR-associated endonuclease Cas1 [Planctomycetia bacterium]